MPDQNNWKKGSIGFRPVVRQNIFATGEVEGTVQLMTYRKEKEREVKQGEGEGGGRRKRKGRERERERERERGERERKFAGQNKTFKGMPQ
jgi:hypothetical protein